MPKSTWLKDKILNFVFRDDTWTKPTNVFWALGHADFTAAGLTASELTIGTGGYARAQVAVANAQWLAPADSGARRVIVNVNQINFGTATANLNGGNPVGFFSVWDASSGGNMLYYGTISNPSAILSGQPIAILAGAAQVLEG